MDNTDILLCLLALPLIVATLLPIFPFKAWWVRMWDFPRLQLTIAMGIVLAAVLGIDYADGWHQILAAALIGCMAYQAIFILPFTPFWKREALDAANCSGSSPDDVSIMVLNVLMTNRDHAKLKDIFARFDPDLVFALETDAWWVDRLSGYLPDHTHRLLHPLDNTYGLALYSRLPLHGTELRALLSKDIPSVRTRIELPSGRKILFTGVHPEPPSPTEAESSLQRDAELIIVGKEIAELDEPSIVAGDLNDVAWSHTSRLFRRISGLLDPRVGRGMYSTFHAHHWYMRWPLDHVFYSPDLGLKQLQRVPGFGSDHFPIFIRLTLCAKTAREQEAEMPDADDHAEARETVAEARREALAAG